MAALVQITPNNKKPNKMKKQIIMAAALLMISVSVALAQETAPKMRDGAQRKEHVGEKHQRLEEMKAELQLTDEQVAKIKEIHKANKPSEKPDRANMTADEKAEMRAKHQEEMKQVRAVLTPEQQKKFDQMHDERRQQKKMQKGQAH